jgi:heme-degrading monooxygenase HmoA
MPFIKKLPEKDFYAVIFCSTKSDQLDGYEETDEEVMQLAASQPGYLGFESVHNNNRGIFISYWETLEAIENWRNNPIHKKAKAQAGKWYNRYLSQITLVQRSHLFEI